MPMIEIPIASAESRFEQENDAFSQSFTFEFEWIEREGFWMLHVFDGNRIPLALGIKVQPNWPLYVHHLRLGSLIFILVATSVGKSLSRETLKSHFTLVAYEAF